MWRKYFPSDYYLNWPGKPENQCKKSSKYSLINPVLPIQTRFHQRSHCKECSCWASAVGEELFGLKTTNGYFWRSADPLAKEQDKNLEAPFPHFGESMALLAALIFSWTSIFFTTAGQRLGPVTVNLLRLPIGAICLAISHLVLTGHIWPQNMAPVDHFWIGLSGVIGLAIGDSALFKSFTLIGPRRGMTMMALAPVYTVILAWIMLDEHLSLWALGGIVVIIAGVIIASMGKADGQGQFDALDTSVGKQTGQPAQQTSLRHQLRRPLLG